MSLDEPTAPPTLDQADPDMARADFDAALAKSIREWAAKAEEVEAARRKTLALRETNDAIEDLRRLRQIGMEHAERTGREGRGLLTYDEREGAFAWQPIPASNSTASPARCARSSCCSRNCWAIARWPACAPWRIFNPLPLLTARRCRARREQAMKTDSERERSDLPDRERPDRNDLNDLYDYDDRAYGEVVADVRRVLDVSHRPMIPTFPARFESTCFKRFARLARSGGYPSQTWVTAPG